MSFSLFVFLWVPGGPLTLFWAHWAPFGAHLGAFLVTFRRVGGLVQICTPPPQRNHVFWGSRGPQIHTFSDFFWLPSPLAVFNIFLIAFIDFWVPRAAQMTPFGSNLVQIRAPLPVWVPSPPQGSPKGDFWVLFVQIFEIFWMDFECIWEYILWGIPRVFWRRPGEYCMDSWSIPYIFLMYSLGIA